MTELFLHYVWRYRLYGNSLFTTEGLSVSVSHPGHPNSDSGPDFFDARIKIGNTRWAGNIEVHRKSSDWVLHGHNMDKAFSGIVLHLVYEDDMPLHDSQGNIVPCVELRHYIDYRLYIKYEAMIHSRNSVPCAALLPDVPAITMASWFDRLVVGRMEKKIESIEQLYHYNSNNLEETFYQWTARSFGFKVNSQPFEMMARSLPYRLIKQHCYNSLQLQALVFGQAGMLDNEFKDDYPTSLKMEYCFLRSKYSLEPIGLHLWKFMRLRPVNFPTVRLAQWVALLQKNQLNISAFLDATDAGSLLKMLDAEPHEYWNMHYRFDKKSHERIKHLGRQSAELIIINTIAPFLFFYGRTIAGREYEDRSLTLLSELPPESNNIIKAWQKAGINASNAFDTQALIELKNSYCKMKKCLDCAIGAQIIR